MSINDLSWRSLSKSNYSYLSEQPFATTSSSSLYLARLNTDPTLPFRLLKLYSKPIRLSTQLIGLQGLSLPHVVKIQHISAVHPSFVVMQLCGDNLRKTLQQRQQNLGIDEIYRMICDIVEGLVALKKRKLIHADVKPENVVLSQEGLKLCDLDYAISEEEALRTPVRVGTLQYMAPEVLRNGRCSYQSDLWSVGIIIFELVFGHHPFPELLSSSLEINEKTFLHCYHIIRVSIETVRQKIVEIKNTLIQDKHQQLLQVLLGCLTLQQSMRADLSETTRLLAQKPVRKSSWFSEATENSEHDSCICSNKRLAAALSHLHTALSALSPNSIDFKKNRELFALIEQLLLPHSTCKVPKGSLRIELEKSLKRMERNEQRFSSQQQKVVFSKNEILQPARLVLQIMKEEDEGDMIWMSKNTTKSADHLY